MNKEFSDLDELESHQCILSSMFIVGTKGLGPGTVMDSKPNNTLTQDTDSSHATTPVTRVGDLPSLSFQWASYKSM